jgi:hypothetical protein
MDSRKRKREHISTPPLTFFIDNQKKKKLDEAPSFPLPNELIEEIGYHLDLASIVQASLVSHQFRLFLQKPLAEGINAYNLLQLVMQGEEALSNKSSFQFHPQTSHRHGYWRAALKKSKGTDPSGRHCEASPLEYAAWAGDKDMVDMMLLDMPYEYTEIALAQLRGVKEKGININGKMEEHLSAVKSAINIYEEYGQVAWQLPYGELDRYWINEIGGAQKRLPINLLQWFCSEIPFHPVPAFDTTLSRNLTLRSGVSLLSLLLTECGSTLALYKFNADGCGACASVLALNTNDEFKTIKRFSEVRTQDLVTQISLLEQSLATRQKMVC